MVEQLSSGSTSIQFPSGFDLSILDENDFITSLNGTFTGRIHSVDNTNNIVFSDTASPVSLASTTIVFKYARSANDNTLDRGEGLLTDGGFTAIDWYEQQKITLASGDVFWKNIAPKPGTSNYAEERKTKNDELNIVVIDDKGSVSGVAGNILEKYTSLSKANDGRITPAQNVHYKTYLAQRSGYIFAGNQDTLLSPGFTSLGGYALQSGASIAWNQDATSVTFGVLGNKTYTFAHGADYGVTKFDVSLGDIISGYEKFRNPSDVSVNYLINGPSGGDTIFESQAKINKLIDIANERKDCVVTASPHKGGVVNVTNPDTQTRNVIDFFDGCTSSSYAVFDSGYKYTFDRFNNKFLYIPLNGDIAGLMCRTSISKFPMVLARVLREAQSTMQLNLHTTHLKHREISSIHRELTQLSSLLVLVLSSSVIRPHYLMHLHSIESTFVVCSSLLSLQSNVLLALNSSSLTMLSQEPTS